MNSFIYAAIAPVVPTPIDWSFWATIVSSIATVVFGVWAILLAKKREYPGQITYFREPAIRLFADITGSLPQIEVRYKGQLVPKNLTLLKGFLVNTGTKDISKEMVEQPLQIILGDGYHWLEASAKCSLDNNEHVQIVNPQTVVISLGLFRCDEFMRFQGLIEVGEGKSWAGALCLDHRIADTGAVGWEVVPLKPKKMWWDGFAPLLAPLVPFLLLAFEGGIKTPKSTDSIAIGVGGVVLFGGLVIRLIIVVRRARRIRRILRLDSD